MKKTLILDHKAIAQKTRRIAYQIIEQNYDATEIVTLGIKGGGYDYARLLMAAVAQIGDLKVSLFPIGIDKKAPLSKPITIDLAGQSIDGKVVLIVDDVANTGRTMYYALTPLLGYSPQKVQTAVLVDRQHKLYPISTDYVGLSLSTTLQEHIKVEIDGSGTVAVYLQ